MNNIMAADKICSDVEPSDCSMSSYLNISKKKKISKTTEQSNLACLMIILTLSSYLTISKVKAVERVCFGGL